MNKRSVIPDSAARRRRPLADSEPLYRRVLGAGFDRLPPQIRQMHDIAVPSMAEGVAEVTRGQSMIARLIGWLAHLPDAGSDIPVQVLFAPRGGAEFWRRSFGGSGFQSVLGPAPGRAGFAIERLGPMRFLLAVPVDDEGLSMVLEGMSVFGVPVPRALWPRVRATERVVDGRFAFDVALSAPVGGLIIRYRGQLRPPRPAADV